MSEAVVRARLAGERLSELADRAGGVDAPAQTEAVRLLSVHSEVVRAWARAERYGTFLLTLGLSVNVAAILYVIAGAYSPWAVVALVAGTGALSAAVLCLWQGNQDALTLAVGLYLDVTPRPGQHGDTA
ncbi:hypothetical protein [Lentzea sp. E54]|uniref:hypothetical protein n=1 Tax=Lentzea xerophila TaxID=3435883 RepID=UPI003DA67A53